MHALVYKAYVISEITNKELYSANLVEVEPYINAAKPFTNFFVHLGKWRLKR